MISYLSLGGHLAFKVLKNHVYKTKNSIAIYFLRESFILFTKDVFVCHVCQFPRSYGRFVLVIIMFYLFLNHDIQLFCYIAYFYL